jgi:glycosyltransferase involved in cell wall biosynthesis
MRVQIITRENGFGLSKDVQVLRDALTDHQVRLTSIDAPRTVEHSFDVAFHLEHIRPDLSNARINLFVPNPDWFELHWMPRLDKMDAILCKTNDTMRIFGDWHKKVRYIGWTSPDPGILCDHSTPEIVHVAGQSSMKGTNAVLSAMASLPNLKATVCWRHRPMVMVPRNVKLLNRHIDQAAFDALRRASIHLCPSTYEGFGHYLNEARAMGAAIITTDAAPMNELVTDFGFRVPSDLHGRFHASPQHHVDVKSLAQAIQMAHDSTQEQREGMGARARAAYLAGRDEFHANLKALMGEIR